MARAGRDNSYSDRTRTQFTKLKAALGNLLGASSRASEARTAPEVEYKGYRIIPTPYRVRDQFQTAGTIVKDTADGVKSHAFVRADTYPSWDDAVAFTTTKAKQIIDLQGDRMFT
jgi:hypothetical protein